MAGDGRSDDQILNELDALSHTLYQPHTKRRTASLALPRAPGDGNAGGADAARAEARPLSRRLSMSPFRSRPKLDKNLNDDDDDDDDVAAGVALPSKSQSFAAVTTTSSVAGEKKGIWGWKPIRALSHIGMQRMGCLFSVEVVAAQGLPPSMDGLRLAVAVRKKETRDGAVQTMPSRVQQGGADFEEMLFVRCNLYCSGGGATGKPLRFEPRPFLISAVAVEAPGLDLGRNAVDLSLLVKESSEKSRQGERVRQWDMAFPLAGKAKGGEIVVKLSFQIMDDGGVGLYSEPAVAGRTSSSASSSLYARKQSKSSFSIASPKVARPEPALTPSKGEPSPVLLGIDDFKLDEPSPVVAEVKQEEQKAEPEREAEDEKADDSEFLEFDVVDKGVEGEEEKDEPKQEVEDKKEAEKEEEEQEAASAAGGDEVVKEVVHDSAHTWRLNELEAITNQIKALENLMHSDVPDAGAESPERQEAAPGLDADEEEVTREFLMLLEQGEGGGGTGKPMAGQQVFSLKSGAKPGSGDDATCYISDLGKGLGPVVQTRDGGYLAAMNPFDIPVERKELPKLAMQLSKPFILRDQKLPGGGAEVFQRLCAGGYEALCAKLCALISMDDVAGKTAEQIAFEGMASAIITARSKELVASSTAAQSVSLLRTMSMAMNAGRQDRIATGIWYAQEAPVTVDEILAFALQKIETMAIEALKVQADMIDDQAPFEVSPEKTQAGHLLDTAAPPEEWASACAGADAVSLLVVVQLRDPLRRYEAVGAPSVVIIQAGRAAGSEDDEPRFKVANLHLGGLRLKADRRNMWDGEKQRLTAMHWLVAYGLGKAGRKSRAAAAGKAGDEVLWSMSSRVMADMWLKPLRNPDVKIPQK
ncbi:protein PLASTID MOVEMENT IMPAIRED 1 isoform X2 [Panicum virgatum]|uniref:protein PLASTID MOVEMENT IMPAIRED 1 isoform X2 n=1 Tax=Panicum virgatum TaxID=38727 RepID=UPI0019D5BC19|nr:protein PLASTID MOVEMENT IMPAIRED 1 isoform X2 [Panicum virgatum]